MKIESDTVIGKKKEKQFVIIELIFWIFIPVAIFYRLFYMTMRWGADDVWIQEFNSILFGIFIALIPVLFRLIFGSLPFQLIRKRLQETKENYKIVGSNNIVTINKDKKSIEIPSGEEYLYSLTVEAKLLSEKIFTRAGVYLMVGILIAITGIAYFSYNTVNLSSNLNVDWSSNLIAFLPRLGGLFFVEFIAFFFLKQYRITMDEFRYYELVKRQRESNLAIILLETELESKNGELDRLMKHLKFFENLDIVKNGETTTLLESRKYSNEELDVLKKIIDNLDIRKNATQQKI